MTPTDVNVSRMCVRMRHMHTCAAGMLTNGMQPHMNSCATQLYAVQVTFDNLMSSGGSSM